MYISYQTSLSLSLGVVKGNLGVVKGNLGVVKGNLGVVKGNLGVVKGNLGVVRRLDSTRHTYLELSKID